MDDTVSKLLDAFVSYKKETDDYIESLKETIRNLGKEIDRVNKEKLRSKNHG